MNDSDDSCNGISGQLFGHKFQPRYSTSSSPNSIKTEWGFTPRDIINLVEASTSHVSTYECDVCVRCGKTNKE